MATYKEKRGTNVVPIVSGQPAEGVNGEIVYITGEGLAFYNGGTWSKLTAAAPVPVLAGVSSANILNPNTYDGSSNSDFFGASVSVSMKYAIAGANKEDTDAYDNNSGVAYIFDPKTGSLLQTLANPNAYSTAQNDNFGFDSDISDSHAIVGAPGEDSATNAGVGKAYIFNASTGSLVHTLNNPDDGYYDQFGDAVSIGNTYAIVGARESGSNNTGKAWIYSVSTGSVVHTLTPGHTATEYYGDSVAISDTHAIVGAPRAVSSLNQGKAYIYSTTTGNLLYTLTAPGTPSSLQFGASVGISDTHAIVGNGDAYHGKAYIYALSNGALVHTLSNPNTNSSHSGDGFGYSVDICNKWAIVAAPNEDVGSVNSGTVYAYDMTDGSLEYTFENPDLYGDSLQDRIGYTLGGRGVAISDGYAIAGIMQEDRLYGSTVTNNSGAICIFK